MRMVSSLWMKISKNTSYYWANANLNLAISGAFKALSSMIQSFTTITDNLAKPGPDPIKIFSALSYAM